MENKPEIAEILRRVAAQNGCSAEEVYAEIRKAIDAAAEAHDALSAALWAQLFGDNKRPGVEEFLAALLARLEK